jgi:hypothetical protein
VARASKLISYLGDALAIEDLSELERGLPILSSQFLRYWALEKSIPATEGESVAGLTAAKVSRVAREVYVLNQITLSGHDEHEREAADLGYRQLTAMLRALDVAVGVVIDAEPKQPAAMKQAWGRSLAVAQAGALMLVGRYPEGALALTRRSKDRLPTSVNPIFPLAVAVATQQTPSGVASALDAGTQRVTVWDLRSETIQFSFSGQFGIAATADLPTSKAGGADWAYVLGLTLPLGVGLSIPSAGTYISLQLTMLDAAQLAAIPLAKKTGTVTRGAQTLDVTPSPTTKLRPEQVLAPGLFFGVAWPKTALLLAFGGSVAPRLREYEVTSKDGRRVDAEQRTVYRVGAKMVIDVPFLEFF